MEEFVWVEKGDATEDQGRASMTDATLLASISSSPSTISSSTSTREHKNPLSKKAWELYFDDDGRIVQESLLRKAVFQGGVDGSIRREVWQYLMGYFPFHTTHLERDIIRRQLRVEYQSLKSRWKEMLEPSEAAKSPDDFESLEDPQLIFMKLQADLNARRHIINEAEARGYLRVIKKDVPRTDRKEEYFSGDDNIHLTWLHDILVTYAVFHPQVGYAQGMNDILSMILYVMDDEADAYNCFSGYMAAVHRDFVCDGMVERLAKLQQLLHLTDPTLLAHFNTIDAGDLVFCHRWLLLSFKREFSFNDSLVIFEILCSHHLELNSVEADMTRNLEKRREKEKNLGDVGAGGVAEDGADALWWTQHKYKFDFFICLAILKVFRVRFMSCADVAALYSLTNGLVEKMDLRMILDAAESIFFDFCRQSAHTCKIDNGTSKDQ